MMALKRRAAGINRAKPVTNQMLSYGFRVKFHLPSGCRFEGVHPKRRVHFLPSQGRLYLVKLARPRRNRFGAREKYVFRGERFPTIQSAAECGARVKRALCLYAAQQRIGLDAGQDRATSSWAQSVKDEVLAKEGKQLRDDVHGLDVYCEQPSVKRSIIEMYGTSLRKLTAYEQPLLSFFEAQVVFSPSQQLALDLYNQSHFENAPKTRFLTLITVVEVLSLKARRSPAVLALIADFHDALDASQLSTDEKQRLRDGLGNLKWEAIGASCRDFVARYADAGDVDYFRRCYKARSELVHDGSTKRPEAVDPTRLDELVSKLLIQNLSPAISQ